MIAHGSLRLVAVALAAAAVPLRAQTPTPARDTARDAARDLARAPINVIRITEGNALLIGPGGNIGVSIGEDGTLLVDDQFAPLTPKIFALLDSIDRRLIRVVINTHWHGDHTGGNQNMARAGALIVAHANVRKRLAGEQGIRELGDTLPSVRRPGVPSLTFDRDITFHFNGDEIRAVHVPNAHTDGDAVVFFRNSNVVHMGDVYVSASYPIIDVASGGSLGGMIAAVDTVLATINDFTRVIPGHGALSNKAELRAYRDMLVATRDRVRKEVAAGKGVEAVVAAGLTREWDGTRAQGGVTPAQFVESVYRSVAAERPARPARPAATRPRARRPATKP